jgi:hypothetical protein
MAWILLYPVCSAELERSRPGAGMDDGSFIHGFLAKEENRPYVDHIFSISWRMPCQRTQPFNMLTVSIWRF